jgi:putative transposase
MSDYRRAFVPGGCWFFTVNLLDRRKSLLTDQIEVLRGAVAATRRSHPFEIDAFVVLPDHLHAIWRLPRGDANFSVRWRLIKMRFAKALPANERLSAVRAARNERGIWQRRFWEHLIRDEADYARHVEYCYYNPSSTDMRRRCVTGRIRRFTVMCGLDCFRRIAAGTLGSQASSVSGRDGSVTL